MITRRASLDLPTGGDKRKVLSFFQDAPTREPKMQPIVGFQRSSLGILPASGYNAADQLLRGTRA